MVPAKRFANMGSFAVGISLKEVASSFSRRGRTISRTSMGIFFHFRSSFLPSVLVREMHSGAGNVQSLTICSKDLHPEHWPGLGRSAEASRAVAY